MKATDCKFDGVRLYSVTWGPQGLYAQVIFTVGGNDTPVQFKGPVGLARKSGKTDDELVKIMTDLITVVERRAAETFFKEAEQGTSEPELAAIRDLGDE